MAILYDVSVTTFDPLHPARQPPTIHQPSTNHPPTIRQPSGNHPPAACLPPACRLPAACLPPANPPATPPHSEHSLVEPAASTAVEQDPSAACPSPKRLPYKKPPGDRSAAPGDFLSLRSTHRPSIYGLAPAASPDTAPSSDTGAPACCGTRSSSALTAASSCWSRPRLTTSYSFQTGRSTSVCQFSR